ncbi:hypothetical protein [Paludisphaera mucosa]|uniref:Uncharacterized protein n=1 Tax=Paludisphaera mucosa TaxID=3030827 RepID=A0ABT6FDM3_9BACT|nr:hypothetical protein [Paludisphaera mucosa]MDG3005654.1 hypothetical protein [Paludisphaera mucosa]
MSTLARRKLYLATSALLLGAIAAHFLSMGQAARGMMAMARAAGMPAERSRLHEAAAWHVRRSGHYEFLGLGLAVLAMGAWWGSRNRDEPGPQIVLVILLGLYLLLLPLMV